MVILLLCALPVRAAEEGGLRTVVIDAGHGGPNWPGASRKLGNRTILEKEINLQVALRLGKLIEREMEGVRVVYTRKSDRALGSTLKADLQRRADIANAAGGDLFISIHANSARSSTPRGAETLIMGESNFEKGDNGEAIYEAYKEELIDMSDEKTAAAVRAYIQTLQFTFGEYSRAFAGLVQQHYASSIGHGNRTLGVKKQLLKVLYATNMPGVLTEIGFMSNPEELRYITSEKGQTAIARSLLAAVKEYKALIEGREVAAPDPADSLSGATSGATSGTEREEAAPDAGAAKASDLAQEGYTVQLCASTQRIPPVHPSLASYRGRTEEWVGEGKFRYKYCTGRFRTRAEADAAMQRARKAAFPQAYVVGYRGRKLIGAAEVRATSNQK